MKDIMKHKFSYLLLFLLLFSTFTSAYGQERLITLDKKNAPLSVVLKEIEKQTSMSVVYNTNDININRSVSIKVSGQSLNQVMSQLLRGTGVSHSIVDKHIVLSAQKSQEQQDRKSTRLNSSHANISYAVFCL